MQRTIIEKHNMKELIRLKVNNFNDRRTVMGILACNGYFVKEQIIQKELISTLDSYEIIVLKEAQDAGNKSS